MLAAKFLPLKMLTVLSFLIFPYFYPFSGVLKDNGARECAGCIRNTGLGAHVISKRRNEMNIYVGNVPYAATETDLEELFGEYGPVATATIIRDRYDGRSKGFGFVEMENQEDGERAIEALDGQDMMGRPLKVNPARPREQRRERRYDAEM
jgi:RNA recognition motif-containing protein